MSKRPATLDSFLGLQPVKKHRNEVKPVEESTSRRTSNHKTYPWPIPHLASSVLDSLGFAPSDEGRSINDQPDLDLVYYQPYIPKNIQRALFEFLRSELFFYRVKYKIKRGPTETDINTPRFTTAFGLDDSARFRHDNEIVDASTWEPVANDAYKTCRPRPIPECLDTLRKLTEGTTGFQFNFALVNYYASGSDSISYHSDDERFLGPEPAIASLTLEAQRDFLLRHKKTESQRSSEGRPLKLPLSSGDMILMKGRTQSCWEHSIPKRKGGEADKGRINITFRRAMMKGGTANYYRYNVGDGEVFRWNADRREMLPVVPS